MFDLLKNQYQMRNALVKYGKYYHNSKYDLRKLIWYYKKNKQKKIAVWGAGQKGTAFLKVIDEDHSRIDCVIDINADYYGRRLLTGHTVESFQEIRNKKIDIVFIMNSNHFAEIYMLLKGEGIHATLIDLDKIIGANMTTKESVESGMVV